MLQILNEARDLKLYKKLLAVLGEYSDKYPGTAVSKMFKDAVNRGLSVIPKDKRAQQIIWDIIMRNSLSIPEAVTQLLNMRFADLEIGLKPLYKNNRVKEVAFWAKDGKVHDKVLSLLNFSGKDGYWSDAEGKKVSLVDISQLVRRDNG